MLVLSITSLIVLADQITKHLARLHLRGNAITVVSGFMDLRFVQNTGAAWGMFRGLSGWLVALSVAMLAMLVVFRRHLLADTLLHRVTMGLMVGGILGNMIDRVRLSYVVDFLDFYWRGHHFPAFNIADSAICIGVTLYIASNLMGMRPALEGHEDAGPDVPPGPGS